MTRSIDLTPTWAGLMPAFVAILESGGAEGRAMAREELQRLAALTDQNNAKAKAAPSEEEAAEERNRFGLESVALGRERAASDLGNMALDFMTSGAAIRAACYWEAAARIAPAGLASDFRVSADLAEKEAAALQTRAYDLARKEERADIAQALAESGQWAAAALACPYSIHADSWAAKSEEAAIAAAPEAFAEGFRDAAFDLARVAEDAKAGRSFQKAAAFYSAAAIAAPGALAAEGWNRESADCGLAGHKARAAAIAAARAEGFREARAMNQQERAAIDSALAALGCAIPGKAAAARAFDALAPVAAPAFRSGPQSPLEGAKEGQEGAESPASPLGVAQEAIRAALAALMAPHYGNDSDALAHASDARAILEKAAADLKGAGQ